MPHDKIRAAARERTTRTGEPYTAARRAVVSEHQGSQFPSPAAGHALRMSGEIHQWQADLRDDNPRTAIRVTRALAALMEEGVDLGDPLVVSTAGFWPQALAQALGQVYEESLERVTAARRGEADAATLVKDIQEQATQLESMQAQLKDRHRHAMAAGRSREAAQAATSLAAAERQAAEMRRLLIAVLEGLDVVENQFPEAIMASADMLRRVRTGKAPGAAVHGYENRRSFLDEFYPGNAGEASAEPATPRDTPGNPA